MILVIDSGATNSNWKLIHRDERFLFRRYKGFNLATHPIDHFPDPENLEGVQNAEKVFFFGAGTGHKEREKLIRNKLKSICPASKEIILGSDLFLSGLANCFNEKGIVSILGTGSNCCLFSSNRIEQNVNNLGFLLGDEGSGFSIGKIILQDYFYHQMPDQESQLFQQKYALSRDELITRVYNENNNPNTYIAGFSDFLNHTSEAYRKVTIERSFKKFIELQILDFEDAKQYRCHFSGSIAWYFRDILQELIINYGLKIGNIIQNPLDSLTYSKLEQIQN